MFVLIIARKYRDG